MKQNQLLSMGTPKKIIWKLIKLKILLESIIFHKKYMLFKKVIKKNLSGKENL